MTQAWKYLTVFSLGLVILASAGFAQTRDENAQGCNDFDSSPGRAIAGCTALIQSGQETSQALEGAFGNRGLAYMGQGRYDRALEDFDQALKLNPHSAKTFDSRGLRRSFIGACVSALPLGQLYIINEPHDVPLVVSVLILFLSEQFRASAIIYFLASI